MLAASFAAACGDLVTPPDTTLPESELLFLGVQSTAPSVAPATFWVHNARQTTRRLLHTDAFGTLFAEVRFPGGSLSALDGHALGAGDSVLVTIQPSSARYEVTVSPGGLEFASGARPWITFSYARYGDLSIGDGAYATRAAYAEALRLWTETTPGTWERISSISGAGGDAVEGALRTGGVIGAAAPR